MQVLSETSIEEHTRVQILCLRLQRFLFSPNNCSSSYSDWLKFRIYKDNRMGILKSVSGKEEGGIPSPWPDSSLL